MRLPAQPCRDGEIPVKLDDLLDVDKLASHVEAGNVTRKRHATLPLSIYTYSRVCQYDNIWDDVTMKTRGLIVDDNTSDIVALPFPKIFVTEMHDPERGYEFAPPLPTGVNFEIFDKVDGSLIILYRYENEWRTATKGSFDSVQSRMAADIIHAAGVHDHGASLVPGWTYLAELVDPSNRIVCDYGDKRDLVLLGCYDNEDGTEIPMAVTTLPWEDHIGSVVASYGLSDDVSELVNTAAANVHIGFSGSIDGTEAEGYVVRYAGGRRAKIKLAAYLALHKLFTGTNEKTIWEVLSTGQDPSVLFDTAPDEYAGWVRGVADELQERYDKVIAEATADYLTALVATMNSETGDRKAFAQAAVQSAHKSALFLLYDDRTDKVEMYAWQKVKPSGDKPFKVDEDA